MHAWLFQSACFAVGDGASWGAQREPGAQDALSSSASSQDTPLHYLTSLSFFVHFPISHCYYHRNQTNQLCGFFLLSPFITSKPSSRSPQCDILSHDVTSYITQCDIHIPEKLLFHWFHHAGCTYIRSPYHRVSDSSNLTYSWSWHCWLVYNLPDRLSFTQYFRSLTCGSSITYNNTSDSSCLLLKFALAVTVHILHMNLKIIGRVYHIGHADDVELVAY